MAPGSAMGADLTAACPQGEIKENGETHAISMNFHSSAVRKFSSDIDNKGYTSGVTMERKGTLTCMILSFNVQNRTHFTGHVMCKVL